MAQYNNAIGNASVNTPPNIRVVILENNNTNGLPQASDTISALKKVDFYICFCKRVDEPGPSYADVIVPSPFAGYEGRTIPPLRGSPRYDLFMSAKCPFANFFIYTQKSIEFPGEVKSYDWVWTRLGDRLGVGAKYNPQMDGLPDSELENMSVQLHQQAYNTWAATSAVAPLNPPSWADFQKLPVFRVPITSPVYPWQTKVEGGVNPFGANTNYNPSGKIRTLLQLPGDGPRQFGSD